MNSNNREILIESVGINAANIIEELQDEIEELHEYLNVIRLAHTKGFKLIHGQNKRANTGFWNP